MFALLNNLSGMTFASILKHRLQIIKQSFVIQNLRCDIRMYQFKHICCVRTSVDFVMIVTS